MKVWIKWEDPLRPKESDSKFTWKAYDLDKYELHCWTDNYNGYHQELRWTWYVDKWNYGQETVDLSAYPPLASMDHLKLICNIERPYDED